MKQPKGLRLPKHCECGGRMLYDFDFGRIFSCCNTCTPVVKVRVPPIGLGKRGAAFVASLKEKNDEERRTHGVRRVSDRGAVNEKEKEAHLRLEGVARRALGYEPADEIETEGGEDVIWAFDTWERLREDLREAIVDIDIARAT